MDLGTLGQIHFTWEFFGSLLTIILIDMVLSGDNAVVIAMAVRSLPKKSRRQGIALGAGAAVLLRVVLTFFAAQLLRVSYVKLVGGAFILWIAVKLLAEQAEEANHKEAASLWHALWIIVVADLTMSLDNVLAVAGASKGNLFLLLFGLGMSIPFLVVSANFLSTLMDRYPVIVLVGSAILGKVGGEMLMTDPTVVRLLRPSAPLQYGVEVLCAVGVIVAAKVWPRKEPQKGSAAA